MDSCAFMVLPWYPAVKVILLWDFVNKIIGCLLLTRQTIKILRTQQQLWQSNVTQDKLNMIKFSFHPLWLLKKHIENKYNNESNLEKHCHSNIGASTAAHFVLDSKLYLRQFRIVIIPESHSTRSKRRRHLGMSVNSVSSVSGVVLLPRNTADWLCCWIARLSEVCVHFYDKQTDVFIACVKIWGKTREESNLVPRAFRPSYLQGKSPGNEVGKKGNPKSYGTLSAWTTPIHSLFVFPFYLFCDARTHTWTPEQLCCGYRRPRDLVQSRGNHRRGPQVDFLVRICRFCQAMECTWIATPPQ